MPTMLVTGGAGFIGSRTAHMAIEQGWTVRVLDNLSTGLASKLPFLEKLGAEVTVGDICDPDTVNRLVAGCEVVLHLAAQVSVPHSVEFPEENHAINIGGLACVLDACQRYAVPRLIAASSAAVYGTNDAFPLDEDDAGHFHSPYAASKWENEQQILRAKQTGMEAVALRFFNVYGTGQRPDGAYAAVIPKFIDLALRGQPPIVFGNGLQTRDFVHVDDVAQAMLMLATSAWNPKLEHVYNIATQTEISLLDLLNTIHAVLEEVAPDIPRISPIFEETRVGDIARSVGNIDRFCSVTSWAPKVSFNDGLRRQIMETLETK
jgi:nucleoside-diphosphate-sugar epimerase